MILEKIKELLSCKIHCGFDKLQTDIKSAKASDLMSDVLRFSGPGKLLLTGLTNIQVVRTSEIAGICAIVFVRNKQPSAATIELSKNSDIAVLTTNLSMFEACGILYAHGIRGVQINQEPA